MTKLTLFAKSIVFVAVVILLYGIKVLTSVINYICNVIFYKMNRCLARYSPRATTTNQPTNRAPNGLAHNDQKCQFWSFLVNKSLFLKKKHLGTLFATFFGRSIWAKMPIFGQKCQFQPNLEVFGPQILFLTGVGKSTKLKIFTKP